MKYLIFNVAVFLALGYLLVGPEQGTHTANMQKLATETTAKVSKLVEPVSERQDRVTPPQTPKVQIEHKVADKQASPRVEEIKATQPAAAPAPPPLPQPVEVAKVEAKPAPEPRIEAVSSIVEEGAVSDGSDVATDPLEEARQRSQELRKLVADMEHMFAQKLTQ